MFQQFHHPTFSRSYHSHRWGFTLIELIIGMTIFAVGLTGILALLSSTLSNAQYSRHEVVAAWLLREQMELVKNIRDTNLENYVRWDKIFTERVGNSHWNAWSYIIENDYTTSLRVFDPSGNGNIIASPVYLRDITTTIPSDTAWIWERTRLYLDSQGRYTHDTSGTPTSYASYIKISPIWYTWATGFVPIVKDTYNQWYVVDARVIVKTANTYREYDAKTTITDWVK